MQRFAVIYSVQTRKTPYLGAIHAVIVGDSVGHLEYCQTSTIMRFHRLTLSWLRSLSYRNQSTDFQSTSMDWLLYDRGLSHERVQALKVFKS